MTSESTTAPVRRQPELAGQTVVVIGGSSGVGLETARRVIGATHSYGQRDVSPYCDQTEHHRDA